MKTYPLVFEEMGIDEQGYYLITCKGTRFRLVKCKPVCEVSKNG
jgi:hypothetical protein